MNLPSYSAEAGRLHALCLRSLENSGSSTAQYIVYMDVQCLVIMPTSWTTFNSLSGFASFKPQMYYFRWLSVLNVAGLREAGSLVHYATGTESF